MQHVNTKNHYREMKIYFKEKIRPRMAVNGLEKTI